MSSSSSIIWLSLHHHLTWCHRRPITSSWNLSTNVSWSSATSWALPEYQPNGWWQVTILVPRWFVLSPTTLLLSLQHKLVRVWCYTWRPVLSSNYSSIPWSITIFYVKNVVKISPPLKNSWYGNTSRHLRSFLSPSLLFLTGIPASEPWRVKSILLATMLLGS